MKQGHSLPSSGRALPPASILVIVCICLFVVAVLATCSVGENSPPPGALSTPVEYPRPSITGWGDATIESICIHTDWPVFPSNNAGSPTEQIGQLLARMGYEVLPAGGACDAVLGFSLKITPLGAFGGTCFNGMISDGSVQLTAEGRTPLVHTYYEKIEPPTVLEKRQCIQSPERAIGLHPWAIYVMEGLQAFWGDAAWLYALGLPELNMLRGNAETFVYLARTQAVPALVDCIQNPRCPQERAFIQLNDGLSTFSAEELGEVSGSTVPVLVGLLSDTDIRPRSYAVAALQEFGLLADEAIPGLQTLCKREKNRSLREAACAALKQIER